MTLKSGKTNAQAASTGGHNSQFNFQTPISTDLDNSVAYMPPLNLDLRHFEISEYVLLDSWCRLHEFGPRQEKTLRLWRFERSVSFETSSTSTFGEDSLKGSLIIRDLRIPCGAQTFVWSLFSISSKIYFLLPFITTVFQGFVYFFDFIENSGILTVE